MNRFKHLFFFVAVFFPAMQIAIGQQARAVDSTKMGWSFGGLPVVAFDSDMGLQYGALLHAFDYGDGSLYPAYKYTIKGEWSRTTKGGGVNQLFFDSEHVLPGIRLTADLCYLTEKAMDFYGFNGQSAWYFANKVDDSDENQAAGHYRSRVFYKHERKIFRTSIDFHGKTGLGKLKWLVGLGYMDVRVGTVDIDALNKGLDEADKLPKCSLVYDVYVETGVIPAEEKDGGKNLSAKLGLIYDSRDNEPNPMRGIWTEAVLLHAPGWMGPHHFQWTRLGLIHRQYLTLIRPVLSLAYRIGYQRTICGRTPFYLQPMMVNSYSAATNNDGLGGARTIRGVLRNRVVGDAVGYGNIELRWKFYRGRWFNQNVYLALNAFFDGGRVYRHITWDRSVDEFQLRGYIREDVDCMHLGTGGGFRIAINENFIVAFDYGKALKKMDGDKSMYINIGYLF